MMRHAALYAIFLLAAALLMQLQARIEELRSESDTGIELLYVPAENVMHGVTLADDATAADILWLRAVFYIGAYHELVHHHDESVHSGRSDHDQALPGNKSEEFKAKTSIDTLNFEKADFRHNSTVEKLLFSENDSAHAVQLERLLEITTNLDPRFATPYYEGAMNLGMNFGRYEQALSLLNKGIGALPDCWEMYYYRGFINLFYFNDKKAASDDIMRAAMKPEAPVIVIQIAAALQVGLGERDMAIQFLRGLREVTGDKHTREKIDEMLKVYERGMPKAPLPKSRYRKEDIGDELEQLLRTL